MSGPPNCQARLTRPGDQPLPCVRSFVPGEAQAGYTPATHPIAAPARLRLPSPQRNYLTDCVSRRRALEFAGSFAIWPGPRGRTPQGRDLARG